MNKKKEIWMSGFALFALFFGAGNLILPPYLGANSGSEWWLIVLGFVITGVAIPILGILAHAKVQGTLYDLGKKVAPWFSSLYCILIYLIAVALPAPRTASVTHEMAIQPFFEIDSWVTSSIYFILTFIFVINRSKIVSLIGKFLTPIIGLILLAIIFLAVFSSPEAMSLNNYKVPFVSGVLEGYQTFDAIGGVVVGAVIIISLNLRGHHSYEAKKELITKSGFIAGGGLLLIYGGLILSGALFSTTFAENATRTEVLSSLSTQTLGKIGTSFLSVLVALACFTTGVGIVTGAADYVKGVFNNSKKAYIITAFLSCVLGVVIGRYDVHYIIEVAFPALMFIYPITIVLIVLNVISKKYSSPMVFKGVVLFTFIFSIPDFLGALKLGAFLEPISQWIPWSSENLGWVLPAVIVFFALNLYRYISSSDKDSLAS
ncbi:MAG: branched-chain amino acid transport system II carrier protein [Flavobacteriaceae bacterium]